MTAPDLTAGDIADWPTPRQAIEILRKVLTSDFLAKHAMLERLRGDMVQAISHESVLTGGRNSPRATGVKIAPDVWERVQESDPLWLSGDLTYTYRDDGSGDRITARHYALRFEPQSIHAIARSADQAAKADEPSTDEREPKGPPVANDLLKAWYEVYKRAYPGSADTEAAAIKSAQGMFPGKSVSRDKIRSLRGERPIGRPKKVG
jgi:hypothetical protein